MKNVVNGFKLIPLDELKEIEENISGNPEDFFSRKGSDVFNQYIISKSQDIEWFTDHFLWKWKRNKKSKKRIPTPEFHREMWNAMDDPSDALIEVSRDCAKTTACSRFYVIHNILFKKDPEISFFGPDGLILEIMNDIRNEFECNEGIINFFGNLIPTGERNPQKGWKKWSGEILEFTNGMKISRFKKGGAVRGKRPTLILADDPQELRDVENPKVAEKFLRNFWKSVYNTLEENGRCKILGTNIGENCLLNQIKKKSKENKFRVITYPVASNIVWENQRIKTADLLWPEQWSIESLNMRINKIGIDNFNQEYLNIIETGNQIKYFDLGLKYRMVKPSKIQKTGAYGEINGIRWFCEFNISNKPIVELPTAMGIDVADDGENADFNGFTIRDIEGRLIAEYKEQMDQTELAKVIDIIFENGVRPRLLPERNVGQALINEMKKYNWFNFHIYKQRDETTSRGTVTTKYGWYTSAVSRPAMLLDYKKAIRRTHDQITIPDYEPIIFDKKMVEFNEIQISEGIFEEIKNFERNEKGRPEAKMGANDDLLIADCITIQGLKFAK